MPGQPISRADEFLRLYNEIDGYMRHLTGLDHREGFTFVVKAAAKHDRAVNRFRDTLISYGELRNAIVHDRKYPDEIIAEPNPDTVAEFKQIFELVTSPPKLIPTFSANLRVFTIDEPLVAALAYMRTQDYSQVIAQDGGGLALLTTEGVARWFERQATTDIVSVRGTTVGDALQEQPAESILLMSRHASIYDAQDGFAQLPARDVSRLFAIIVTEHGKRTEKPLGIVTPWDLLEHLDR